MPNGYMQHTFVSILLITVSKMIKKLPFFLFCTILPNLAFQWNFLPEKFVYANSFHTE